MFRQMVTRVGVPAVVAAMLLMAGPARAQHGGGGHGGGGFGGGFHGGGFAPGGLGSNGFHGNGFAPGGLGSNGFHGNGFAPGGLHSNGFHRGGYYPGYYYGYSPSYGDYPSYGYDQPYSSYQSYDLGDGSDPDLGSLDSSGGVAPSYSSGYQGLGPSATLSLATASAQADPTAHVTVRGPANAEVWIQNSRTTSTGPVREFQSPPLTPGRYTYEIRARWTENGRDITQTQKVAVAPGAHMTVDFPTRSGTD